MLKLGDLPLGDRPRVAVAIRDGVRREDVDAVLADGADVLELRIDQFASRDGNHVVDEIGRFSGIPLLGTIRNPAEGGAWAGSEGDRAALFVQILPHVDALDIELSAREIREEVISAARSAGKLVIGSYHDFDSTPSYEALAATAEDGNAAGVHIVKIGATCQDNGDLRRLARFTLEYAAQGLITIGMGPAGLPSRVLFPALGSLLTYTFLGEPTAPGQLNCGQLLAYLRGLYLEASEENPCSKR